MCTEKLSVHTLVSSAWLRLLSTAPDYERKTNYPVAFFPPKKSVDTNHFYLISRTCIYILTGNRVSLTMSLVGFSKLIHFDVLLGNAKCTILVLNMRWVNLHSVNLIDQEPEVLTDWFLWWLCALHTLLRTLLAMGSTDRLPEEGGRLLRTGGSVERGLERSTDILK